jgi:hypothetical protein
MNQCHYLSSPFLLLEITPNLPSGIDAKMYFLPGGDGGK